VLLENRKGLIADAMVTEADGRAEREAALRMVHDRWRRREPIRTVAADKAYDTRELRRCSETCRCGRTWRRSICGESRN
jgi:hypothetical protein